MVFLWKRKGNHESGLKYWWLLRTHLFLIFVARLNSNRNLGSSDWFALFASFLNEFPKFIYLLRKKIIALVTNAFWFRKCLVNIVLRRVSLPKAVLKLNQMKPSPLFHLPLAFYYVIWGLRLSPSVQASSCVWLHIACAEVNTVSLHLRLTQKYP